MTSIGIEHIPFNLRLRQAREAKGWSRKRLATEAGIDASAIGAYERLKRWPAEERLISIAIALGRPIDELFPEPLGVLVRMRPAQKMVTEVSLQQLTGSSPLLLTDGGIGAATDSTVKADIDGALANLTPRARHVIELRFGLKDGRSRTMEEVAKEFGVTRERIRQIEAKALRRLRRPDSSRRLRDYV